jgi:hypothetical protein
VSRAAAALLALCALACEGAEAGGVDPAALSASGTATVGAVALWGAWGGAVDGCEYRVELDGDRYSEALTCAAGTVATEGAAETLGDWLTLTAHASSCGTSPAARYRFAMAGADTLTLDDGERVRVLERLAPGLPLPAGEVGCFQGGAFQPRTLEQLDATPGLIVLRGEP